MKKTCMWCKGKMEDDSPANYCTEECAAAAWKQEERRHWWSICVVPNLRKYGTPLEPLVDQNKDAWDYAKKWDRKSNLYLFGGEGVGKSACARYLLCQEVNRGRTVYQPPMTLLQQAAFSDPARRRVDDLLFCATMLLDDVHDPCLTDKGYSVLRYILDSRHEAQKRTLVTTNKSPEDLMKHMDGLCGAGYGLQLLRRLAPCKKFELKGKSYRQTLNEEVFS